MQETREEEGLLKDKASELETKIESGLLRSFKRIRRGARNGLGIVTYSVMHVVVASIRSRLSASWM